MVIDFIWMVPYTPQGNPLHYYLSASSHIAVTNFWEVTKKDIDRFDKTMLKSLV